MAPRSSFMSSQAVLVIGVGISLAGWRWWSHRKIQRTPPADDEAKKEQAAFQDKGNSDAPPVPLISIENKESEENAHRRVLKRGSITIVHGSVTGTCKRLAELLFKRLERTFEQYDETSNKPLLQMGSIQEFDWWDEFINDEDAETNTNKKSTKATTTTTTPLLIVLLPTYTNGMWSPPSQPLETALTELQNDWRIAKLPLKHKLQVALFGMGSSAYADHTLDTSSARKKQKNNNTMGRPVREAVRHFQKLGAKNVTPLRVGDDAVGNDAQETFDEWCRNLLERSAFFQTHYSNSTALSKASGGCGCSTNGGDRSDTQSTTEGCACNTGKDVTDKNNNENEDDYETESDDENEEPDVLDMEDMGDEILSSQASSNNTSKEPREMVTPSQAKALKKEGYKLIGTHSAVKMCRWTKHQLRGRGGCYKHTFYGITSYQCMEATPSLACANKCVFCWRHHKNPVGKEWRWKTDDPNYIVEQAVKEHVQMIKEAKGIPGVQYDRWKEAHTVRHCALSLVGEPIMYPRIDEFLADLHRRKISTFLVTNGQHPQAIASLRPITQLYVSVDAPTQESLIAIDRPLFQDAWDRLKESLSSLREKGQRTVARLTVVKGWNSDELEGYARLIALGRTSLVEVKGVTFCGKSDASNLNMSNTPWHHEVVELTRTLRDELEKIRLEHVQRGDDSFPRYDLACEHKHSVSVLLARVDQFSVENPDGSRTWRTWIDYDRFQELAERYAQDPSFSFGVEDYTAETPAWALFGANEEGFDPTDRRHRRKQRYPKYTKYDDEGIPTHDHENNALDESERSRMRKLMEERRRELGGGSTVTEYRDGSKQIQDASLMFRGLMITKEAE